MKRSVKLISLIMAAVMVFSASCVWAAASAIPVAAQDSLETLIRNNNLAEVAGWLITNLNAAKTNVTGTLLKLILLSDREGFGVGDADVTALSDGQLAKIMLDWLDSFLPELSEELTATEAWPAVMNIFKLLGVTIDLSSVDGVVETFYTIGKKANSDALVGSILGDLKALKPDALKGVKRAGGDLNLIFAVLQWINDNQRYVKAFIIGGFSNDGIKLSGSLTNILGDNLDDINRTVRNIPDFLKGWLYMLIDGYAEKPDLQQNPKGGWGDSPYASYTADELLAAALIGLLNDSCKKSADDALTVVPKADAKSFLSHSVYGLLAEYGKPLFTRFAVPVLNDTLKAQIVKLKEFPDTKDIFNYNYQFTDASFDGVFARADTTGLLGQLNNVLYTCLETMLSPAAFKAIAPVGGGNENLNGNLAKVFRYALPILANHSADLGVDLGRYTADAVKEMELPELAAGVLKCFFPAWFKEDFMREPDLLRNAGTVAQLGLAAVKYAVAGNSRSALDYGVIAGEYLDRITPDAIGAYTDADCVELIVSIVAKLGAYTLDDAGAQTYFALDKAASAGWTWEDYCDEIVDWAIGFVKGFPAVMLKYVTAERGVYDGNGPFYKLNVALNELLDFSFLNGVNDETFRLDSKTLLFDALLGNVFRCDAQALANVFERNTQKGNLMNGPLVKGAIGAADRVLTALFSHTCGASDGFEKELDCTHAIAGSFDSNNGHYLDTPAEMAIDNHDMAEVPGKSVAATCGAPGIRYCQCTKCGYETEETVPATGDHDWGEPEVTVAPTCAAEGEMTYTCTVCGEEKIETTGKTDEHTWDDGIQTAAPTCTEEGEMTYTCTVCGTTKTETVAPAGHRTVALEGIAPTCTESGLTEGSRCLNCGEIFIPQEEIPALGHNYGAWEKLDEEQHQRVCANDASHVEKEDHAWNDGEVTLAPTCTEEGATTYTCTVCGATRTETVAPLGHDPMPGLLVLPTCFTSGQTAGSRCERCGEILVPQEVIPALGHNYGPWEKLDETQHMRVCANDAFHVEKEVHAWDEGTVTKAATLEAEGEKTFTCTVCSAKKTEPIGKLIPEEKKDETTGVAVTFVPGAFSEEVTLKVQVLTEAQPPLEETYSSVTVLDISMYEGADKVQPESSVTVKIPVPEGYRADAIEVYHFTDGGGKEKVEIRIENGWIVFTVESFSMFAVVDTSTKVTYTPGDVDNDGKITSADARLALRRSVGLENYAETSPEFFACDVNKDGSVTSADARLILRASVGLEDPAEWK